MSLPTLYHLSHIDLDGYSCQIITHEIFDTVHFFNANYGPEVLNRIDEILALLDAQNSTAIVLISDLNLSLKESRYVDTQIKKRQEEGIEVTLLLLDHHGSGKESADAFEWYTLDTQRSATKITYDYAQQHWGIPQGVNRWLKPYVDVVNAVDLWLMDEVKNFEYGKVCMRLVTETRELNRYLFPKEDHIYKFTLLKEAASMIGIENAPIKLDEKIHAMKKHFFIRQQDNTLDGLATAYIVYLVGLYKEQFTVHYRGFKGIFTYALGNTSIIGNGILKAHPDVDFVIDLGTRGSMSFRADFKIDVSIMAKELVGGGGHPNASGGRMNDFKEQYEYVKAKAIMETLLAQKEPLSTIPTKVC